MSKVKKDSQRRPFHSKTRAERADEEVQAGATVPHVPLPESQAIQHEEPSQEARGFRELPVCALPKEV